MPRNLVITCDGTNNEFGPENTNVVRLVQCLDRDVSGQLVYYDPGVGTLPEPGRVGWIGKKISTVAGLAFGAGLKWKVREAYRFLMDEWEPGDRVFLYGFSRGAYTARVLAAFLHMFGLLPKGNQCLVPYAMRLFSSADRKLDGGKMVAGKFWDLCEGFRETFARQVPGRQDRRFPIHFMGVWDTVSSVGWVWDPTKFPFTKKNPSVATVRHAVSVDERRWFFRQNLFEAADEQELVELWFPGVHCDVGGGYPRDGSWLWQDAFQWMLGESRGAGLRIDPVREQWVWEQYGKESEPWRTAQHESLKNWWWLAEFFPKLQYRSGLSMRVPAIGLGRRRRIEEDAAPHESTLRRMMAGLTPPYRPPNAPARWWQLAEDVECVPTTNALTSGTDSSASGREDAMLVEHVVGDRQSINDTAGRENLSERTTGGISESESASGFGLEAAIVPSIPRAAMEIDTQSLDIPTWLDESPARRVSLIFATTRKRSDASDEIFSGERDKEVHYGQASVRVPEERNFGQVRLPFQLRIFGISLYTQELDPRKHFRLQRCEVMTKTDWLRLIKTSNSREGLVFVHGFNVSFLDGVYRCAQIAWDIEYRGIPILFSWASRGDLFDYGYDRNSALVARSRFVELLCNLREAGLRKVHVLAHSMGNFSVLDALATHDHIAYPLGVGELLMAAPDIDSDQYLEIGPRVRRAVEGMTLYASSMDRALAVSKVLAGDVPRAGDVLPSGPVILDQIDSIDVTAVGDDIFGLNHGVFATKKSILNDVKLLLARGIRPPSERLAEIRGMPEGQHPAKWWRYVY